MEIDDDDEIFQEMMADAEPEPKVAKVPLDFAKHKGKLFSAGFGKLTKSEFYKASIYAAEPNKNAGGEASTSASTRAVPNLNAVLVNQRQRGNPALKAIRNVPWEFAEIIPDYVMGQRTCALFLSLRYHSLNPDYIHERLKPLGRQYELRVLLVQVDTKDPHHSLKHLTRICLLADLTLMLAWSAEEAGRIIETYKIFEQKPPDLIMEKKDGNSYPKVISALTSVRSVNKTDAATLLSTFGTFEAILNASQEDLSLCPGIGPQKASKLHKVLHEKFRRESTRKTGTLK